MLIVLGAVVAVTMIAFANEAEASSLLHGLIEGQVHKSANRTEVLKKKLWWAPVRLGSYAARFLHLRMGQDAWILYEEVNREIEGTLTSKGLDDKNPLGVDLIQASTLFHLWRAENRIRWMFMRDSALGMLLIGTIAVIVGWFPVRFLKRRMWNSSSELPVSSRLAVTPDDPLDFHLPQADPKAIRLHEVLNEKGCLTPLAMQIIGCVAASPDHPASLQDHLNLPGGLIEHTARTIEAITPLAEDRPEKERKLCLLMALCHDLGKLLAYEKIADDWIDRKLPHDRISALIVASIPEVYSELSSTHREALILALRYYHNPEELPTMAPPMSYTLLEIMHKADAIAYEQEKGLSHLQVEGVKPYLWEACVAAIPHLNVNRYRGGYPEGFTSGELVYVLEHALREKTLDQLPAEIQQKLPIRRPSGRLHPAWPLLVEVLKEKNILVEQVKGRKTNPSALFNITASGTTYKCVVALSLDVLATLFPEVAAQWRQCSPYEVQIAGGRYGG